MSADPHAGHNMSADPHAGHRAAAALTTPRTPIPVPTAADLAAAFPVLQAHSMEHAPSVNRYLLVDQLEAWNNASGSGQAWALHGWWGSDTQRLWLRAEGEHDDGDGSAGSIDLLHGQATGPWWEALAGLRHEHGPQSRTRAAVGVQGLSPYRIETQATVLIGGEPRAELEVEGEYSMLLSNRLILQPSLEASALLRDDRQRGLGRGLSSIEGGLRLRYEITRRFAPYVGVVHERLFGRSADFAHADGHHRQHTRWVAGVRFWF